MTDTTSIDVCNLPSEDLARRIAFIRSELLPRSTRQRVDAAGATFEFPGDEELARQLRELVNFERGCCPSLKWELQEGTDVLTLRVGGLDPTSPLLQSTSGLAVLGARPATT